MLVVWADAGWCQQAVLAVSKCLGGSPQNVCYMFCSFVQFLQASAGIKVKVKFALEQAMKARKWE